MCQRRLLKRQTLTDRKPSSVGLLYLKLPLAIWGLASSSPAAIGWAIRENDGAQRRQRQQLLPGWTATPHNQAKINIFPAVSSADMTWMCAQELEVCVACSIHICTSSIFVRVHYICVYVSVHVCLLNHLGQFKPSSLWITSLSSSAFPLHLNQHPPCATCEAARASCNSDHVH